MKFQQKIIAHRGAWKKKGFPQNSIASLRQAIELRCGGSEFDVRMTSDDCLVIHHDPKFHNLEIEKTSYADLDALTLPNGEKLPTLKNYLLAGIQNNKTTRLVCEIKPSGITEKDAELALKVVSLVHQLHAQQWLVIISFDVDILKKVINLAPEIPTQYLGGNKSPEELKADGIAGADYEISIFKNHPGWIESAGKNHVILNAWTADQTFDMDWLLANHFNFITTNEPELLQQRIKESATSV